MLGGELVRRHGDGVGGKRMKSGFDWNLAFLMK